MQGCIVNAMFGCPCFLDPVKFSEGIARIALEDRSPLISQLQECTNKPILTIDSEALTLNSAL